MLLAVHVLLFGTKRKKTASFVAITRFIYEILRFILFFFIIV